MVLGVAGAALDGMSGDAGAFTADAADGGGGGACGVCCGIGGAELSFAPSTLVATSSGERAIGSLAVGDTVLADNPTTGKSEPEPVLHLWRNHDHDLVDVQLTTSVGAASSGTASDTAAGTAGATTQQPTASKPATQLHRWTGGDAAAHRDGWRWCGAGGSYHGHDDAHQHPGHGGSALRR